MTRGITVTATGTIHGIMVTTAMVMAIHTMVMPVGMADGTVHGITAAIMAVIMAILIIVDT